MPLTFQSMPQLLSKMVAYIVANTPLTDINAGSVLLTLLEAAASNDYEQFLSMVDIVKLYNIDTTSGSDLDERALEFGLERLKATAASGYVTVTDTSFTKVATKIFAGLPGPIKGQKYIYIEDASGLDAGGGTVIIGRGLNTSENAIYTSPIINHGSYYELDLTAPLSFSHGTEETVIRSHGGLRTIPAGTNFYAPATDINPKLNFTSKFDAYILDGEQSISNILVIASDVGTGYNVPAGSIIDSTGLWTAATVTNPLAFTNGTDTEPDQNLRDRIKNQVQSLSRATKTTLLTQLIGVTSSEQNDSVVSTYFDETTEIGKPSLMYIDDGTGLEATWSGQGYEEIVGLATGGEQYFQLDNYPLVKASIISAASEPYDLTGGLVLTFTVNGVEESINLNASYIRDLSNVSAEEVAAAIQLGKQNFVDARTTDSHTQVIVSAKDVYGDSIVCNGGSANSALLFPVNETMNTLNLYKNDVFLNKDGYPAFIVSGNASSNFSIIAGSDYLMISVDGTTSQMVTFYTPVPPAPSSPYTADDIAYFINNQIAGVVAVAVADPSGGKRVKITSNNTNPSLSHIQITGGTTNALSVLNFPTTIQNGTSSDYTLNRYNGQLKLMDALSPGDKLTAGTYNARAWLQCGSPEPYAITAGQTLLVTVDDNIGDPATAQTFVFRTSGSYTAQQISDLINNYIYDSTHSTDTPIIGATFFSQTEGANNYLAVRTNTLEEGFGNITVDIGSTATSLNFSLGLTAYNQAPNLAYTESTNSTGPLYFGYDQYFMVVLDGDAVNRSFNVAMGLPGSVTTAVGSSSFNDSSLPYPYPIENFFRGCILRWNDDTTTPALQSQYMAIDQYNSVTGLISFATPWGTPPVYGDTYTIYPASAVELARLITNPHYTSLGIYSEVSASHQGERLQIASSDQGDYKTVQVTGGTANSLSIQFDSNGTSAGTTTTSSIDGLSLGLPVTVISNTKPAITGYVSNVVGSYAPYTVSVDTTWPATAPLDISLYDSTQGAGFESVNPLDFNTKLFAGQDSYKYFTGLVREVQRVMDGWDQDLVDYPGYKACGPQIEITTATEMPVTMTINVIPQPGVALSTLVNASKAAVSNYIGSLGIGDDAILAEITAELMAISGVSDVKYLSPTINIVCPDGCIVRISEDLISIV